jgi:hypothetical protein
MTGILPKPKQTTVDEDLSINDDKKKKEIKQVM